MHVGRKAGVDDFVGDAWHKTGCTGNDKNDTAFLSQAKSLRGEEWCICNPATCKNVEFNNIRDYP